MEEYLQVCFSWPILPASVLLCIVTAYWLLVIIGSADVDLFDFDIDLDPGLEGHQSILDWGLVGLKWFNLGQVPLMVWMTAFALAAWIVSMAFDKDLVDPTTREIVVANLRNFGVGLFAAKVMTQPLRGVLKFTEPNRTEALMGQTVTVTTSEATTEFGQAQYVTDDGAPLMLNVRAVEGTIIKGSTATIVDYAEETGLFYIESRT